MEQLSDHFSDTELRVQDQPARVVGNARFMCLQILEPIREEFGALQIHSGFRDPAHNEAVGGVHGSFHLYEGDECACDFSPLAPGTNLGEIFDWLRNEALGPEWKPEKSKIVLVSRYGRMVAYVDPSTPTAWKKSRATRPPDNATPCGF